MKIIRYFQSCILVEDKDTRILIDPSGQEVSREEDFGLLDAVLYTHEHPDHFDAQSAENFYKKKANIYANAATASKMTISPSIVEDGAKFEIKGLKIKAIELPHCLMVDGSPGPQNTGYVINGKLFHPGDGKELNGLRVDILALPISGPDISLKDAADFARQLKVKEVVPIHYDFIGTKPEVFTRLTSSLDFEVNVLNVGESIEL